MESQITFNQIDIEYGNYYEWFDIIDMSKHELKNKLLEVSESNKKLLELLNTLMIELDRCGLFLDEHESVRVKNHIKQALNYLIS